MGFQIPSRAEAELAANPALAGAALREEAMDRVYAAADPEVKSDCRRAIREVAGRQALFTSDEVWEEMICKPEEPRILGPMMRWAQNSGVCERTEGTVQSTLPQNHRRPIRVWKSLIVGAAPAEAVVWPREPPGFGFVCADCRCPVDEHVRGNHAPGCSMAFHNESLAEGAEAFVQFRQESREEE